MNVNGDVNRDANENANCPLLMLLWFNYVHLDSTVFFVAKRDLLLLMLRFADMLHRYGALILFCCECAYTNYIHTMQAA